jgi:hypothetical protein
LLKDVRDKDPSVAKRGLPVTNLCVGDDIPAYHFLALASQIITGGTEATKVTENTGQLEPLRKMARCSEFSKSYQPQTSESASAQEGS